MPRLATVAAVGAAIGGSAGFSGSIGFQLSFGLLGIEPSFKAAIRPALTGAAVGSVIAAGGYGTVRASQAVCHRFFRSASARAPHLQAQPRPRTPRAHRS